MKRRFLTRMNVLPVAAGLMLLAQLPAAGQKTFTVGRTAWGDPDLEGVYTFATLTPFQRPAAEAGKAVLTEQEQKALEEQLKKKQAENIATNEHFSYNALWFVGDQGRPTGRTSLIVDPESGRMPPFTPLGEKLRAENAKKQQARLTGDVLTPSWEDHTNYNRCIARSFPRISHEYNQGVQILQTPKDVTIFYESMQIGRAHV